jgi:carnitine-CoA ligase
MPTIDPLGSVAHRIPVDVLRIQPDAIGDRPYLVDDENGELSFGQVDDIADRHAVGYADLGLGKGDTAAIFMENSTTLAATTFGINRLGAIWSPVSTEYRGEWLRELLTADDTNQQDPEVRPAREWRGAGNVGPDDARRQLAAHQTHRKMDG